MDKWMHDIRYKGESVETAARRIQHKWNNYKTWKLLKEIFQVEKAKKNKHIVEMASVAVRFWKKVDAQRIVLETNFLKYREYRMGRIRYNLLFIKLKVLWEKYRHNFFVIREKDRKKQRRNGIRK
jgi:hypothetical protein